MTNIRKKKTNSMPVRDHMWAHADYSGLDAGIRFAVRVLHAAGLDGYFDPMANLQRSSIRATMDHNIFKHDGRSR